LAKTSGYIASVKPFLISLKNSDFRMSDDLYHRVLQQVEED
jgi:predicted nucleic acid-binding protein